MTKYNVINETRQDLNHEQEIFGSLQTFDHEKQGNVEAIKDIQRL